MIRCVIFQCFRENVLDSLADTAMILRKDICTAKTILHLLENLDCNKCQGVLDLCSDELINSSTCSQYNPACKLHDNVCSVHGNPAVLFLRDVASATMRKNVEKLPTSLE